jgi:predicted dehydrogenase
MHAAHAELGLRIGADVILEKPPALSGQELEALTVRLAERVREEAVREPSAAP